MNEIEYDFPCSICGGDVGHIINCPRGSAFTSDYLLKKVHTLEEKVKDCERSYRDQLEINVRLIEDLKQAESRLKRLQESVNEHKSAPPNIRLTMEHDVKLYKVRDEE